MAKARGLEVRTESSGSRFDRRTAINTVQSHLDAITLTLKGADETTIQAARRGGTQETDRLSVRNLVEARALLESRTPKISALVILSRPNVRRVSRFLEIAEELEMDSLPCRRMNALLNPDLESQALWQADHEWIRGLPPQQGKLEVVYDFIPHTTSDRLACPWPQNKVYLTVEGDGTPCKHHFDARELKLGNVFEQDAMAIWNDQHYRMFRAKLWHGELPDKCKTC